MTEFDSNDTSQARVRRQIQSPMRLLGIVMTIIYVALGAYMFFYGAARYPDVLTPEYAQLFGGMLIVYGLYRGWRVRSDFSDNASN
jgi:hypothetical protein